ncbi:MarR family transcriptional regulator [Euzebya pacifica]|uniref:MarR family winged helix-turn-helix transcriptional regulator n=1 Tax=Euzebya pacifica TaxID=1608957 RepID=UPI0030F51AA9
MDDGDLDELDALDALDVIRGHLAETHPDLDTSGLAITGRLLRAASQLDALRAERLQAHDLTVADFDVLATIRRRQGRTGINPSDLQDAVMISSGGMTKRLDRLESAGLLRRKPDPDDRRGVIVQLTRSGRRRIDAALVGLLEREREDMETALPNAADRDTLAGLLRPVLRYLEGED